MLPLRQNLYLNTMPPWPPMPARSSQNGAATFFLPRWRSLPRTRHTPLYTTSFMAPGKSGSSIWSWGHLPWYRIIERVVYRLVFVGCEIRPTAFDEVFLQHFLPFWPPNLELLRIDAVLSTGTVANPMDG